MAERARRLAEVLRRYLDAIALTHRPGTVARYRGFLWGFLHFLEASHPRVESFSDLRSRHVESWLHHEATQMGHRKSGPLRRSTRRRNIFLLSRFLDDLRAWGWEGGIPEVLIQRSDLPPPYHPTWDLGVEGERQRGFKVIKMGDMYFSVPASFEPGGVQR